MAPAERRVGPAVLLARLVVLAVLATVFGTVLYQRSARSAQNAAIALREAATLVLGEHLVRLHPDAPALVVSNPFVLEKGRAPQVYAFEEAGMEGLRRAYAGRPALTTGFPKLRPEFEKNPQAVFVDPKTTTPLSFLVAEGAFDALSEAHPDRQVMISLIGLPVELGREKVWQRPGAPHFALLLPDWRVVGGKERIRAAFKSQKIVAAVVEKPGSPPPERSAGQDERSRFDSHFILVTTENIDRCLASYPQLWPR